MPAKPLNESGSSMLHATRAREELHLFAAPQRSIRGEILRESSSLLRAAWPAAERHFVAHTPEQETVKVIPSVPPQVIDVDETQGLDIAATVEPTPTRPPTSSDCRYRSTLRRASNSSAGSVPDQPEEVTEGASFARPEGSFAARAFGNAVHGFLELLTKRLQTGVPAATPLSRLAGWSSRIEAVLRAEGLPAATVEARSTPSSRRNRDGAQRPRGPVAARSHARAQQANTPSPPGTNGAAASASTASSCRRGAARHRQRLPMDRRLQDCDPRTRHRCRSVSCRGAAEVCAAIGELRARNRRRCRRQRAARRTLLSPCYRS